MLLCCGYAIADASGSIVVGVIAAELVCMYGALIFFVRGEEKPDEKPGEDKPCEEQCFCLPGCALNKKRKKRKERKNKKRKIKRKRKRKKRREIKKWRGEAWRRDVPPDLVAHGCLEGDASKVEECERGQTKRMV